MSSTAGYKAEIQQVWREMAPQWEARAQFIVDATRDITAWMIEHLDPRPGQIILDLAGGTGTGGFQIAPLVGPAGKVISTDFAPEMVEAARRAAGELGLDNVEFRVLDAENNDLPSASVDGVFCRWGYMLMPEPALAMSETHRVLRPGGRLAYSVMADPAKNPWASIPFRVLVDLSLVEPVPPDTPGGLFSLAGPGTAQALATEAGFGEAVSEEIPFRFEMGSPDDYWRFLTEFAGAISAVLQRLTEAERARAREEIIKRVDAFREGDGYVFPGSSINVAAAKAA